MNTPGNNTSDHPSGDRPDGDRPDPRDLLIARRARALYREASQHLDTATTDGLRAARRQALMAAHVPQRHSARWLIPTGAFAAVAFVLLMAWQPVSHRPASLTSQSPGATDQSADVDSDLPPDADKADPNLYQNLDFYGWLAANDAAASQPMNR